MKTEDDYIVAMTVTDYQEDEIDDDSVPGTEDAELGTIEKVTEEATSEDTEKQ